MGNYNNIRYVPPTLPQIDMSNPYQSPLPDEFLDEGVQKYEGALEAQNGLITRLRDRIVQLEAENERLKWQLVSPQIDVLASYPEGADID